MKSWNNYIKHPIKFDLKTLVVTKISFMDKEEFRRRRAAIKAKSDKLWGDIEEHRTEEKRVIDVLHNAESILEKLDMTFEERMSQ